MDPFVEIRKTYESVLKEYNNHIVEKFSIDDFREYNNVLLSAHSCNIEGNSFSVDETRALKEKGINFKLNDKSLLEAFEILDHFNALKFLEENKSKPLDEKLLKETHRILTLNSAKNYIPGEYSKVQMGAGDTVFRDTQKAISSMPGFLKSINDNIYSNDVHPLELSAIFHQMFIYRHPFRDGNGRLGRLMSNFILNKRNHPNIIIKGTDKQNYIDALKASEKHNTRIPTIHYFYNVSIDRMKSEISQKKNLFQNFKLGISTEINYIDMAVKFHKNTEYQGKIPNVEAYGLRNPLVKAFKERYGIDLDKNDLKKINSNLDKDIDQSLGY